MKKIATIVIASLALSACGTKTIIKEVAPSSTNPPITAPATNKYEDYVSWVKSNSGQANTTSESLIIETGDIICTALDAGRSVKQVADLMEESAVSSSDVELFAAVLYGAVQYLCPEYRQAMTDYLSSI